PRITAAAEPRHTVLQRRRAAPDAHACSCITCHGGGEAFPCMSVRRCVPAVVPASILDLLPSSKHPAARFPGGSAMHLIRWISLVCTLAVPTVGAAAAGVYTEPQA